MWLFHFEKIAVNWENDLHKSVLLMIFIKSFDMSEVSLSDFLKSNTFFNLSSFFNALMKTVRSSIAYQVFLVVVEQHDF